MTKRTVDLGRIYPYIIPKGYLDSRPRGLPTPKHLGHELYLALAESFDGISEIHLPEDLGASGTPEQLLAKAQENLVAALKAREIGISSFKGPSGVPFILFGGDWRAAACLLLPDLHAFTTRNIGEGPFCVSVPHRDAMLVFPDAGPKHRSVMQAMIAEKEADGPKPLTPKLFSLGPEGFAPLEG